MFTNELMVCKVMPRIYLHEGVNGAIDDGVVPPTIDALDVLIEAPKEIKE